MTYNVLNLIGGSHQPAKDGAQLENVNPATCQIIGTLPRTSSHDAEEAVKAALEAQPSWGSIAVEERAQWLDQIADR